MVECLLCQAVREPSSLWKVYEDEHVLAVLEPYPIYKGHTIVFTKKHYGTLMSMPLDEVAGLFKVVAIVSRSVQKATGAEGITLLQCNGESAWQSIPHVYVSIIPRFPGDKMKIDYPAHRASDEVQEDARQSIVKEIQQIGIKACTS